MTEQDHDHEHDGHGHGHDNDGGVPRPGSQFFTHRSEGEPTPLVSASELPQGCALHVARSGKGGVVDRLAAANADARSRAIERIGNLFPGYDVEATAQNVDDRRFTILRVPDELLAYFDAQGAIDHLLVHRENKFAMNGITFSRGELEGHRAAPPGTVRGIGTDADRGLVAVGGLANALSQQWTTIVNSADRTDRAMGRLCNDLSTAVGCNTNVNVYLSYGPAAGFGAHWDAHDTIIVQVLGKKEWAVFEPVALAAQTPWIEKTVSERCIWEGELEPGMALVIPRGWGHEVRGSTELSAHYTIGLNRLEVRQILDRAAWESGYWPTLRADVPYDIDAPTSSYGGSVFDEADGLREAAAEVLSDDMIERAIAAFRARIQMRLFPSLPATFRAFEQGDWSGCALQLPAPAGIAVHRDEEHQTVVAFDDRLIHVDNRALDAFLMLAHGAPMKFDELPVVDVEGNDERQRFARDLLKNSLAEVIEA